MRLEYWLNDAAFVLAHKIREALAAEVETLDLSGVVEVVGCYIGGHVRPANYKENRKDRRKVENKSDKRRVVVVMRERNGRTLPFVFKKEGESVDTIAERVAPDATVHADEAAHWDKLHAIFLTKRINHQHAYSDGEACTNAAESFFSRIHRAEMGHHHHLSGPHLNAYAREMAWRDDHRRISNGDQVERVAALAMGRKQSVDFTGYWQRKA